MNEAANSNGNQAADETVEVGGMQGGGPATAQAAATGMAQGVGAPAGNNRRRQIIVNRPVQSRIILNVSWPPAVALAVTVLLLGVFSTRLLDEALMAQVELPSLIPILLTVILFMVVAVAYLFFNALTFSHRIAGPMYRLQRTLEAARSGNFQARANLRSQDFLVEVADELNQLLAYLEKHPPRMGDETTDPSPTTEPATPAIPAGDLDSTEQKAVGEDFAGRRRTDGDCTDGDRTDGKTRAKAQEAAADQHAQLAEKATKKATKKAAKKAKAKKKAKTDKG